MRTRPLPTRLARRVWPLLLCALSGCKCGSDQPYTPFGVASTAPSAADSAPAPEASASAAPPTGFAPRKAELAPGGVKRWNLGGTTIEAPADRRFEQAVVADFDADGETEIVAWLRASDGLPAGKLVPAGELWLFPAGGQARPVMPLPSFVPTGPGCRLLTQLAQTGPHSVALDTRAACDAALMPRAPVGALAVVAPLAEEPQIHLVRYAAEAPGEKLELTSLSDDRDGDGKDDAAVRVALTVAGKTASAELSWFDRAAGASRDKSEPGRSLARAAAREAARAKQKKTAAEVVERVALIRRLAAWICSQGGAPRLFDRDGSALPCEGLDGVVDSLAAAEIGAELARGNVLEAFGAHSRDGWYLGAMSPKQRATLEKELLAAVTRRTASARAIEASPSLPQRPRFSPLAFEPEGSLLVQTRDGVRRFSAEGTPLSATSDSDAGLPAWPLDVSDGGARFTTVTYACDRAEIVLGIQGRNEVVTRLLAPRPGLCSGARLEPFPELAPLAFSGGELELLLGGARLGNERGGLPAAGSPRSSDGRFLVAPTRLGLLVLGGDKPELWQPAVDGPKPTELSDCVVANERRAAACLAAGKPTLLLPSP